VELHHVGTAKHLFNDVSHDLFWIISNLLHRFLQIVSIASLLDLFDSKVHRESVLTVLSEFRLIASNPSTPLIEGFLGCFLVEHTNSTQRLPCLCALLLLMLNS
jgi:hypothetical protein